MLWEATNHNPIATLARLSPDRRAALLNDADFASLLGRAEAELNEYLTARTWFQRTANRHDKTLRVAYFCAEYGLHEALPQYAGGLGVLAGDHLKAASISAPLAAVGLLPLRLLPAIVRLLRAPASPTGIRLLAPAHQRHWPAGRRAVDKRLVHARIWLVRVGRVPCICSIRTCLRISREPGHHASSTAATR